MQTQLYPVTETEIGPMVSESRVSVYDVMEAYDEIRSAKLALPVPIGRAKQGKPCTPSSKWGRYL